MQQNQGMGDEVAGSGPSQGLQGSEQQRENPLSDEQLNMLKELYGLDKPWYEAYIYWLWDVVRLDFGMSTRYYEPVIDMLVERLPVSAYYGILTFLITYLVCIPLGIAKAFKHKSAFDNTTSIFTFLGFAIPGYVAAVVLMVVAGAKLEWFPISGFTSDDTSEMSSLELIGDVIYHSILPMTALSCGQLCHHHLCHEILSDGTDGRRLCAHCCCEGSSSKTSCYSSRTPK